jgi:hypothetical protein
VIGLSRSGNHAIIRWILQQAPGRTCFLNCVEGKTNPYHSARPLASGLPFETNIPHFDWERECRGAWLRKDLLVYSYEDSFLGYVCHPLFAENQERWLGRTRQQIDILIVRDPFNLFASRQRAGLSSVSPATAVRIWKQHAREALGQRQHRKRPHLWVYYNRWVTDRAYRQQIAARMGLPFSDTGIDRVPSTGGGSSFDGLRYDGAARQMKVLERWKVYQHDPDYLRLFDAQVLDLAQQLHRSSNLTGTEQGGTGDAPDCAALPIHLFREHPVSPNCALAGRAA